MLENTKKGFTIIEVVIVLVIGAVIMMMVFLVVPQLQRSQRDSRRQNDARQLLTAMEQWSANNNGKMPATQNDMTDVINNYIKRSGGFISPSGQTFTGANVAPAVGAAVSTLVTATNGLVYRYAATCSGNAIVAAANENNRVAVMAYQENGGSFCVSN